MSGCQIKFTIEIIDIIWYNLFRLFGGGNYGIIGTSNNNQGAPVITINNETSNFTENKEYLITSNSSGGQGLSTNGSGIINETISENSFPSSESKWIFESAGGSNYYIKNASNGKYLYVSYVSQSGGRRLGRWK